VPEQFKNVVKDKNLTWHATLLKIIQLFCSSVCMNCVRRSLQFHSIVHTFTVIYSLNETTIYAQ